MRTITELPTCDGYIEKVATEIKAHVLLRQNNLRALFLRKNVYLLISILYGWILYMHILVSFDHNTTKTLQLFFIFSKYQNHHYISLNESMSILFAFNGFLYTYSLLHELPPFKILSYFRQVHDSTQYKALLRRKCA